MRLIKSIVQMGRLLMALTLVAGPTGPAFAGLAGAPSSLNKEEAATLTGGAEKTQSLQPRSAGNSKLPMYFEANHGQTDASVKFFTRAAGYNLYLTGTESVTVMPKAAEVKGQEPVVVRMTLKGGNAKPAVQGVGLLPGRTSYFFGNDKKKWQVGAEQYSRVKFNQVYPGIDMVYRFSKGNAEYDFVVAPGANPSRIILGFEGAKSLRLDPKGNLVLGVEGGELTYKAPELYQKLGSKQVPVKGRFVLASNNNVRFEVGNYIKSKELVIDPQLSYSTYLGGSVEDKINAIAVDGTKQAYVTGYSRSAMTGSGGFPSTTPAGSHTLAVQGPAENGGSDVFVAKLSADGSSLLWVAWLGGGLDEQAYSIALDKSSVSTPKVFITGVTASAGGTSYPVAGPANVLKDCAVNPGLWAFVTELQQPANIPALVYSGCWGGASALSTVGNSIAVDSLGAAYITGTTFQTDFPVSLGIPFPHNTMGAASQAAFVTKIAPAGAAIGYSMFMGPQDVITNGNAITVDAGFQAWVGGMTTSSMLPSVLGHFSSSKIGTTNAFVAKINAAGTGLLYATYINGNSDQAATAIALNNGGAAPYHVFVAGWTLSSTGFPSTAYYNLPVSVRPIVYQKDLVGADDPFILRLNPAEPNPVPGADNPLEMQYATHLGATGADRAYSLALDDLDDAYIAGWTLSSDWTLAADPVTPGANGINVTGATTQNTSGGQDAFVAAIGPTGQYQPFFTYLGATPPGQAATGIAVDSAHNIYVAGYTPSAIFPLVTGSLMDGSTPAKAINRSGTAGAFDGFVTKIAPVLTFGAPLPPPGVVCTITGVNPSSGYLIGGDTVTITGTGFDISRSTVEFDGIISSSFTVYASSTVIAAVTSSHTLAGVVPLTVTTPNGTCSANFAYVVPVATCTITSISPVSGFTVGGTTVTIIGTGFFGLNVSTNVTFGGVDAVSYTVNASSTMVSAVSPRRPLIGTLTPGSVLLTLNTSSGTCTAVYDYVNAPPSVCTISNITPGFGFTPGGNVVTVTGTGFYGFSGPGGVTFDGVNASAYTANVSSTVITATVPRHPLVGALMPGVVPFRVTTGNGTCSASYTYVLAPAAANGVCGGEDYFFPSPATGDTANFAYCMALPGTVRITVYNAIGDLVAKIEDSRAAGGQFSTLNTGRLATGVYLYRLEKDYGAGNSAASKVKKFVVQH
ncbi:MAG: IPT/TIG domain-containing protein [Elusimicrobiales bacterium]|nr:IPT/TIG domain-containing protein [Elusimicrobiales bacterium]